MRKVKSVKFKIRSLMGNYCRHALNKKLAGNKIICAYKRKISRVAQINGFTVFPKLTVVMAPLIFTHAGREKAK